MNHRKFEQWWDEKYGHALPEGAMCNAFKEVAFEAWKSALTPPKPPVEIMAQIIYINDYIKPVAMLTDGTTEGPGAA